MARRAVAGPDLSIDRIAIIDKAWAMTIRLISERLTLRRLTPDDVDRLFELDSDPGVMRYLTGGRSTPREVVERDILPRWITEYDANDGLGVWAANVTDTGEFIGWCSLRQPTDGQGRGLELGYRLRQAAWGRGLASEGARALVREAFADLGATRVFAQTMSVNAASRRVMEKAGLRYVRTFFLDWGEVIDGSEHGDVEYALSHADWIARQTSD